MRKRFVAGAVCPSCQAMDRLVVWQGSDPQTRECVACGYKDTLDQNGNIQELPTRVNQAIEGEKNLAHQADIQILKLD